MHQRASCLLFLAELAVVSTEKALLGGRYVVHECTILR